jgi:uracil-DNA glycosylase family protein
MLTTVQLGLLRSQCIDYAPALSSSFFSTITTMSRDERSAADFFPQEFDLESMREAAGSCRGCDLYKDATQTVFGEGPRNAKAVFVGEQPGDEEDVAGHPFIGPAGRLLSMAMGEAGIDRSQVYLTNAVKHFKWKPRGKRRIHEKPRQSEILACSPWLDAELALLQPKVLVCLGATAAQGLFGKDFRVTTMGGQWFTTDYAPLTIATVHPSAILRAPAGRRDEAYEEFVQHLKLVSAEIAAINPDRKTLA